MDQKQSASSSARQTRVLLVEDEWIVALDLEAFLTEEGYTVVGPAGRAADALQLISDDSIDIAVLDINLAGENSKPIALRLRDNGVPFIFLSGNSEKLVDPDLGAEAFLNKPVSEGRLLESLSSILHADSEV